MRKLLLLVLITLCCNVYAQKHDMDSQTRLVIVNQDDKDIHCRVLIDKAELQVDLKAEYYWYQNQQIRKNRGGYSGDLLHGMYKCYDSEERLVEEGMYVYGRKEGIWKVWDDNGELIKTSSWKNGLQNGLSYQYFYDKGWIKENYKNNRLHGRRVHQTVDSIHYQFYRSGELIKQKTQVLHPAPKEKKAKKEKEEKKDVKQKKEKITKKDKKGKKKKRSEEEVNQQET